MRTEREIKNRIHELEGVMNIAITKYYRGDYSVEVFKDIYSDVWDEMKTLYWGIRQFKCRGTEHSSRKSNENG